MTAFLHILWSFAHADSLDIITQIKEKQEWTDNTQHLYMVIDGKNTHKEYELVTHLKKTPDTLYAHAQFLQPKTVTNTQIIILNHSNQDDEMWLFLPALNRVTVLKDGNRKRAFMGSDFAFDDFMLWDIPQSHTLISKEDPTTIVSIRPTSPSDVQYSHWDVTIDNATRHPQKIVFFVDEQPYKSMLLKDYDKGFPTKLVMNNLQSKSTTTITLLSIDTTTVIPLETFNKETLTPSKAAP